VSESLSEQAFWDLVELRRDLHRHPELRFQEFRTAGLVAARLGAAGLEVTEGVAGTGVVATLGAGHPHVLIRADMDALPTSDLKDVEYRSQTDGVCHACGHDVHVAVVLGVAEQLAKTPDLPGRVTVVFQPAEEIPFGEESGGRAVVDTGVLADVDLVLGLHCWPWLPAGTVGVDERVAMASKSAFKISVHGLGAHAAAPDQGRDAIVAASHIVTSLHQLQSRETRPGQRATINVGTIIGGRSQSIVPPTAELTGTIRSAEPELGATLRSAVERVVAGVSTVSDVEATVDWKNDMPPVINDGRLVRRALDVLAQTPSIEPLLVNDPPMTADDFALYAEQRPGLYIKLGVASPDGTVGARPLHDSRFDVDERAIAVGVAALAALTTDLLENPLEATHD
jgi:amidohydrolase